MSEKKQTVKELLDTMEEFEFELWRTINKMMTDFSKKTGLIIGLEAGTRDHPYYANGEIVAPKTFERWYAVDLRVVPLFLRTCRWTSFQEELRVGAVSEREGKEYDSETEEWVQK